MEKSFELTGKRREKFVRQEVPELREPIEKILGQLREKIDNGTYFLIIGDDASGRVPALVFDRFLKAVYKGKGYPPLQTMFVAGSGSGWLHVEGVEAEKKYDSLEKFAEQIPLPGVEGSPVAANRRILIVTDAVVTGYSLRPLLEALANRGVGFDIATLGFDPERSGESVKSDIEEKFGAGLYSGGKNIYPKVLRKYDVSGVTKTAGELFAWPSREAVEDGKPKFKNKEKLQRTINDTRHDVDLLAQKLLEWYKKEPAEK